MIQALDEMSAADGKTARRRLNEVRKQCLAIRNDNRGDPSAQDEEMPSMPLNALRFDDIWGV